MQQEFAFTTAEVRGRESKRLVPQFALTTFGFQHGLRDRLVDACGTDVAFRFAIGRALHRHSAGIWGPVSVWDGALNEHILMTRNTALPLGRWVISWHPVADVMVEIATDIGTGETRIRKPYSGRHLTLGGELSTEVPRA